jgi:hypothetical protein
MPTCFLVLTAYLSHSFSIYTHFFLESFTVSITLPLFYAIRFFEIFHSEQMVPLVNKMMVRESSVGNTVGSVVYSDATTTRVR